MSFDFWLFVFAAVRDVTSYALDESLGTAAHELRRAGRVRARATDVKTISAHGGAISEFSDVKLTSVASESVGTSSASKISVHPVPALLRSENKPFDTIDVDSNAPEALQPHRHQFGFNARRSASASQRILVDASGSTHSAASDGIGELNRVKTKRDPDFDWDDIDWSARRRRKKKKTLGVDRGARPLGNGTTTRETTTTTTTTSINCAWEHWGPWTECTVTCGGGDKERRRGIWIYPVNGGNECAGPRQISSDCGMDDCPTTTITTTTKPTTTEAPKKQSSTMIYVIGAIGGVLVIGGAGFAFCNQAIEKKFNARKADQQHWLDGETYEDEGDIGGYEDDDYGNQY